MSRSTYICSLDSQGTFEKITACIPEGEIRRRKEAKDSRYSEMATGQIFVKDLDKCTWGSGRQGSQLSVMPPDSCRSSCLEQRGLHGMKACLE